MKYGKQRRGIHIVILTLSGVRVGPELARGRQMTDITFMIPFVVSKFIGPRLVDRCSKEVRRVRQACHLIEIEAPVDT